MKKQFRINTDTVGLAIWDTSHVYEGPALPPLEIRAAIDSLNKQTARGDLFFVYTGINETFPVEIVINDQMDSTILENYNAHTGAWLLRCPSGRIAVGDLVNFRDQADWLKDAKTTFSIDSGDYRTTIFEFDFDRALREHLGETRFDSYFLRLRRNKIIGMTGVAVFIAGFFLFKWYISLIALFVFATVLLAIMSDKDHQETAQMYADFSNKLSVPYFVICLSSSETIPVNGGQSDRKLTFPASFGRIWDQIHGGEKTDNN